MVRVTKNSMRLYIEIGKHFVSLLFPDYIKHHGVKGQHWGVKNGPPYPIDRNKNRLDKGNIDGIIKQALEANSVSLNVKLSLQEQHLDGEHRDTRKSLLYGDLSTAQRLIEDLSGTGEPLLDENKNWIRKERVRSSVPAGEYNPGIPTRNLMIVYSKSGSHIYPRKGGKHE